MCAAASNAGVTKRNWRRTGRCGFVTSHIVGSLCLGALLTLLDSWLVPVVDADIDIDEYACFFNPDVRLCFKRLMIDNDGEGIRFYGCCSMVKKHCDEEIACPFNIHCKNIPACPPSSDNDEDVNIWDADDDDHEFHNIVDGDEARERKMLAKRRLLVQTKDNPLIDGDYDDDDYDGEDEDEFS